MRVRSLLVVFALAACRDEPPRHASATPESPPVADPGAPAPPLSPTGSPGCGKPARAGTTTQHVRAAGKDRSYLLVVPEGYSPETRYPLVVALHGSGGSASSDRASRASTDLERVAAGRAIFVYLDAGGREWDLDSPAEKNPDVAFFDLALLGAHNALCLAPRRVFVTGFSNGAYMANQLGCRRGDAIRGIVTNAGGGPYALDGSYDAQGHLVCPQRAVAALVVHGLSDGSVAPSEGEKSIEHWTYANKCGSGTSAAFLPPCVAFEGCYQPVGTCKIPGLGHAVWKDAGRATWAFIEALH